MGHMPVADGTFGAARDRVAEALWRHDFPHAVDGAWSLPGNHGRDRYLERAGIALEALAVQDDLSALGVAEAIRYEMLTLLLNAETDPAAGSPPAAGLDAELLDRLADARSDYDRASPGGGAIEAEVALLRALSSVLSGKMTVKALVGALAPSWTWHTFGPDSPLNQTGQ